MNCFFFGVESRADVSGTQNFWLGAEGEYSLDLGYPFACYCGDSVVAERGVWNAVDKPKHLWWEISVDSSGE